MAMQVVPYAVQGVPIAGTAAEQGELNEQQKNLIMETLGKGCPDEDLRLFFWTCEKYQLNPFGVAQVYAVPRTERYRDARGEWADRKRLITQVGINGLTLIAERTGRFEGVGRPEWCGPLRNEDDEPRWRDAWLFDDRPPAAARVAVWKRGAREPTWGIAMWAEWAQWHQDYKTKERKLTGLWASKPAHMLAKCATAIALRRAFQQEFAELRASFEPALDESPHRARLTDLYAADPETIEAPPPARVLAAAGDRPFFEHEVIPRVVREPAPSDNAQTPTNDRALMSRFWARATGKPPQGLGLDKARVHAMFGLSADNGELAKWVAQPGRGWALALDRLEAFAGQPPAEDEPSLFEEYEAEDAPEGEAEQSELGLDAQPARHDPVDLRRAGRR